MDRSNRVAIAAVILVFSACVWGGTYSGGFGRRTNPYRISTVADWQELISTPNDWDKRFIMLNDLDMQGVILTPVAAGSAFSGVFDGRGHVIRNVVINQPESDNVGLFGCLSVPGEICNLGVEDVNITGNSRVGALVGIILYTDGSWGSITDCYAAGRVSGGAYIGGLVGETWVEVAITKSYALCQVSGRVYIGGLVGYNRSKIIDCYAAGDVSGSGSAAGGLVGLNEGTITSCYAAGDVSGERFVGGLVGQNAGSRSIITACGAGCVLNSVLGVGGLAYRNGGIISECFWDVTGGATNSVFSNGGTITNVTAVTTADMMTASTYTARGWDFVNTWTIDEGVSYPSLMHKDLLPPLPQAGDYSSGDGSGANPYRIGTIGGWMKLVDSPNDWDKSFILTNDIDMQGCELLPVAMCSWKMNMLDGTEFTGVFDGNNHAIRNAIINIPHDDYAGLFGVIGQGGQVFNLGVEDVNITGKRIVGGLAGCNRGVLTSCYSKSNVGGLMDVGGLVGYNLGGTITSCRSDSPVSGSSVVGGLVGDSYNGTISDCYAVSDVDGYGYTGGLLGSDSNGVVTTSSAKGNVSGKGAAGGLIGVSNTGSEITYCSYLGSAVNAEVGVGGLAGISVGSIINSCYATADYVKGKEFVGGFAGVNRSSGEISSSYSAVDVNGVTDVGGLVGYNNSGVFESFWDSEIQTYGVTDNIGFNDEDANIANIFGLTTAKMMTQSTYTDYGWDFTTPVWKIKEGLDYPRLWWENFSPPEQILLDNLILNITGLGLPSGVKNSLLAKLNTALEKLQDDNEKNDVAAANNLKAFINSVKAQRGKKISQADAGALIAGAEQILELLGNGR